jgi:hypothetical protein
MVTAPAPKPQSPLEQWLRTAHSSEWFEVIERHESTGWSSIRKPFTIEGLVKHFSNPEFVSGIRQEKLVRYGVVDIDHKEDYASQYWHQFAKSPELIELEERAERIGCRVSFLRSSHSGGLHVFVGFPEAIHAWLAHWLMTWLLEASGMAVKAGQAEVFPSRIDYRSDGQRARSNGFRLPGQEGSALIVAESFYEGTDTIYGQLLDDLENTEYCREWKRALNKCKEFRYFRLKAERDFDRTGVTPETDIEWKEGGNSNEILRRITTIVRMANRNIKCAIQLGKIIRDVAMSAPGFNKFASEATKKDLMRERGSWAERWAKSSLSKRFCGMLASCERDSGRNERLSNESKKKIKDFSESHPEAASWSKRKLAREIGIARGTLEKHWEYWVSLMAHTPSNNGGGQLEPPIDLCREEKLAPKGSNLQVIGKIVDDFMSIFTEEDLEEFDLMLGRNQFSLNHDQSRRKQSLPMGFCT